MTNTYHVYKENGLWKVSFTNLAGRTFVHHTTATRQAAISWAKAQFRTRKVQ